MCCIMLVSLVVFGVEEPHPAKKRTGQVQR